jgi:hypothetical protein
MNRVPGAKMVMENACVAVDDNASVTLTVKLVVAIAFGVPEITPVLLFNVAHPGRDPEEIVHVYGVCPPAAVTV